MPNAFVNTIVSGGIEFAASAVKNFASSIIDTGMQFESSMSQNNIFEHMLQYIIYAKI